MVSIIVMRQIYNFILQITNNLKKKRQLADLSVSRLCNVLIYSKEGFNLIQNSGLEYMLGTSVVRQNIRYSDLFSFAILDKLDVLTEKGIIHLIEAL